MTSCASSAAAPASPSSFFLPTLGGGFFFRGCHSFSGVGDVAEIFFPDPGYDGGEVADGEENLLSQQCVPYHVDRRVLVRDRPLSGMANFKLRLW